MTHLAIISFILLQVTISTTITAESPGPNSSNEYQCQSRNAEKTDCALGCETDKCPVNKNYSRDCAEKCKPGCKCRFNEKFASNGTCIPTQFCPPFECDLPNEEYVACPSYCGDGCSQGCPTFGMLMVVECFPDCRCKEGFRRKDGRCVRNEECEL